MSRSRRLEKIIQQRRQQNQRAPREKQQTGLALLLDQINAFGTLEAAVKDLSSDFMAFGPLDIRGIQPQPWSAVVIWYRPQGYHHYRKLYFLGIWAQGSPTDAQIIVGTCEHNFQPAFYNPEAYFRRLPQDFALYYGKLDQPPDAPLLMVVYQPENRLSIRQQVTEVVNTWKSGLTS